MTVSTVTAPWLEVLGSHFLDMKSDCISAKKKKILWIGDVTYMAFIVSMNISISAFSRDILDACFVVAVVFLRGGMIEEIFLVLHPLDQCGQS